MHAELIKLSGDADPAARREVMMKVTNLFLSGAGRAL